MLEIVAPAAQDALALLIAFPWHWLAVAMVFLVVVEAAMFIPRVGFSLKLALAGILNAQILVLCDQAARGIAPHPLTLWQAVQLPVGAQGVLAFGTLVPFALGVAYLAAAGRPAWLRFFFGNVLKDQPPPERQFLRFKCVMQLATMPFTFLPGAVALLGLSGGLALETALRAALAAWPVVLVYGAMGLAFEWLMVALPARRLPRVLAVALVGVLLVAFLLWAFAFQYALSVKVLT